MRSRQINIPTRLSKCEWGSSSTHTGKMIFQNFTINDFNNNIIIVSANNVNVNVAIIEAFKKSVYRLFL